MSAGPRRVDICRSLRAPGADVQARRREGEDLYEEVCHRLLRIGGESQEVIERASALCVATYWKTGDRTLPFARAAEEQRALLKTLLNAGLLIEADSRVVSPSSPIEVRFFHDSMQTYLTARGLTKRRLPARGRSASGGGGRPSIPESGRCAERMGDGDLPNVSAGRRTRPCASRAE